MSNIIKIKSLSFLAFLFIMFVWQDQHAQCANCTADGPLNSLSYSEPAFAPDWTTVQTNNAEGRDYMLFYVTKGQIYRWTTYGIEDNNPGINVPCLNTSECSAGLVCEGLAGSKKCEIAFDTELTLLKGACSSSGQVLAYNQNGGFRNQSQIEWKADFSGTIFLLLNNYKCLGSCDKDGLNCMKTSVKWQRMDSSHCTECSYSYPTTYPAQSPAAAFSNPVASPSWTTTANAAKDPPYSGSDVNNPTKGLKAGEFQIFNVVKGRTYRWSTCSVPNYDTQLSLFRGEGQGLHCSTSGTLCTKDAECPGGEKCVQSCGKFLAYSDDSEQSPCGLGSKQTILEWTSDFGTTATPGKVTLLNNSYNCGYCNKSPNPTNPWGHCPTITMDWQRYDCNTCSSYVSTETPDGTVRTKPGLNHGDYVKFHLTKGVKYRFRSTQKNTGSTFTGMLTLRYSSGTACSGDFIAQSKKRLSSHEHEIVYTATSTFDAELLVSGADCGDPGSGKTAVVSYVEVYDPSGRFMNPFFDESSTTPSCCNWTGVTLDTETGLLLLDNNVYKETWNEAISYCANVSYTIPGSTGSGGEKVEDWTLPNINELYSVVDFDLYDKATSYSLPSYVSSTAGEGASCTLINQESTCSASTGYPQYVCGDDLKCVRNNWYWSSTSVHGSAYFSWGVNMKDGRSYIVLKEDRGGVPATKHKVICVRSTSVSGELDIYRAAKERIFSGWACDKNYTNQPIEIYFVVRDNDGKSVLNILNYLIKGGKEVPGKYEGHDKLYGFYYGKTDLEPAVGSAKETKINNNCDNTANKTPSKPHAFELDLNSFSGASDKEKLAKKIREVLETKDSPYYVTAYAGNYQIGWHPKSSFVLPPENEIFVLDDDCGDNIISVGEECDDGNNVDEKCAYNTSCIICDHTCHWLEGESPTCGDSSLDLPDESCDCGPGYWTLEGAVCSESIVNKRCPDYGMGACTICNEICQAEILSAPYCGDGYRDTAEQCDDGDQSNNNSCLKTCLNAKCGDGYIFNTGAGANESCDDGTKNGYYETSCDPGPCCNETCNGAGPKCGDSILQRANCSGYPGCVTITGAAEICDLGTDNGDWKTLAEHNIDIGCNATCSGAASYCGDGFLQSLYEICDDGPANQDGVYGKCKTDCSAKPRCGDGTVDTVYEKCDDGTKNGSYGFCDLTCQDWTRCGDHRLDEAYEECDNGETFKEYDIDKSLSCKPGCLFGRWCGDNVIDDGNLLYSDTSAYYRFNDTGTTAGDSSGSGKNGTIRYASRAYGESTHGIYRGVFFDKSSHPNLERVTALPVIAYEKLTLEAWVFPIKYATSGGYSTIILGSGAYSLSLYNDGSLRTLWTGKLDPGYHSTSAGMVPLNVWTHVVAVWDASDVKLYINGVLNNTITTSGGGNVSSETVIGAETIDSQFYGIIDEVAIYTKALEEPEIKLHYEGIEGAEFCDNGDVDHGDGNKPVGEANVTYQADCSEACKWFHYCGDGVTDGTYEVCDDGVSGNIGAYSKCNPGCTSLAPYCGDGIKDDGEEECDKGIENSVTSGKTKPGYSDFEATCRTNCLWAVCGDGVVDLGEECDCGVGDFIVSTGDGCVWGGGNSNTVPSACRTTCVKSKCGDRVQDPGEQCDDGDPEILGLVAHYKFDDGTGSVAADAQGAYNGTISGAIWYPTGKYGKSLYFDGVNDYVSISNPLSTQSNLTQEWTVTAWVNIDDLSTNQYLVSGMNLGLELSHGSTNRMLLYLNSGSTNDYYRYSRAGLVESKGWVHVAFVFRNSDGYRKTYVNGADQSDSGPNKSSTPSGLASTFQIGLGSKGFIDDVRIYGRALDSAEVLNLATLYTDSCNECMDAKCSDGYVKTHNSDSISGDGVDLTIFDEQCDDGNTANGDYCKSDCMEVTGRCGDGTEQGNEQCDGGLYCTGPCSTDIIPVQGSNNCSPGCIVNHGFCGDEKIDSVVAGEICDDKTGFDDYCSDDCKTAYSCGDGTIQHYVEQCEKTTSGEGVGLYCRNDCKELYGSCGDSKVQGPGYTAAIYGGTTLPTGAGWTINGPEACDINDPRTDILEVVGASNIGCGTDCKKVGSCGNGTREKRFEGCDGSDVAYSKPGFCHSGCKSNPAGNLESATNTLIKGWGCDPDYPMDQVQIRLEFSDKNGASVATVPLLPSNFKFSEPTIQNYCGGGANHRWEFDPNNITWTGKPQPYKVKAYAIPINGLAPEVETLLGEIQFTMAQVCRDGVVQRDIGQCGSIPGCVEIAGAGTTEECDDGNVVNIDDCTNGCKNPVCGDSITSTSATGANKEICENGNTTTCVAAGVSVKIAGIEQVTGNVSCKNCKSWDIIPTGCSTANSASKALCKCTKAWDCPDRPYWNNEFDTAKNNVEGYDQYWVGAGTWDPIDDNDQNYDTVTSSTSCRFVCGDNLTWDTGQNKCVGVQRSPIKNCDSLIITGAGKKLNKNAGGNTNYTQTWTYNGSAWDWVPADDSDLDYSASYVGVTNPCTYRCDNDDDPLNTSTYNYYDGACYLKTKTFNCSTTEYPGDATASWNTVSSYSVNHIAGTSTYTPAETLTAYNETPSNSACRFKCDLGRFWNNPICKATSCGDSITTDTGYYDAAEKLRLTMDENGGSTAYDSSGNNNNGTIYGATSTSAKFQYGLSFDGVDDYVSVPDKAMLRLGTAMTIQVWVKVIANPGSWARLVGKSDAGSNRNYGVFLHSTGTILFQFYNASATSYDLQTTQKINDGNWHNVTATYNGANMIIYIDGVLSASTPTSATPVTSAGPVRIGGDGAHGYFKGYIDHVRIFSKALSSAEIKNAMGEFCDNYSGLGNSDAYNANPHCNSSCTGWGPYCGDGVENGEAECDSAINYASVAWQETLCDRKFGARDYYDSASYPTCSSVCGIVATAGDHCSYCGDGLVSNGEVCDDGTALNDGGPGHCNSTCTGPKRLYVRTSGSNSNNGQTWATAFASVQRALDEAKTIQDATPSALVDIWVSQGTYTPTFAAGTYALYLKGTNTNSWYAPSGYAITKLNVTIGTTTNSYTVPNGDKSAGPYTFTVGVDQNVSFSYSNTTTWSAQLWFEVFRNSGNGGAYFRTVPTTNYDNWNKYRHFELRNNVRIYGGFASTGTPKFADRNTTSYPVNLSGSQNSVTSYHVFDHEGAWQTHTNSHINSSAVLDGVTISYGNANGAVAANPDAVNQWWSYSRGGGVFTYTPNASRGCPTLTNITIGTGLGSASNAQNQQTYNGSSTSSYFYCYDGLN